MVMTFDGQGRRIVNHNTLLTWWRGTLERNDANRRSRSDTPITAHDLLDLP